MNFNQGVSVINEFSFCGYLLETFEIYIKGVWDAENMVICKKNDKEEKRKRFAHYPYFSKSMLKATTHYQFLNEYDIYEHCLLKFEHCHVKVVTKR